MRFHFNQVSNSILDIKVNTRSDCFNFGMDNAFPSMIEALINMSVTAKTCTDRVAKAIYGGSFGEQGLTIVNSKGQSLNEVLRIASRQYSRQNNCYLHIGYDGNFEINSINSIPVTHVRVGKTDDRDYSGKYIIYDNWDKSRRKKISSSDFKKIDRFNPDKKVVEKQVVASGGDGKNGVISDYNGQLLHIRKDESFIYSLSDLNPVLSESLLEANSQAFRSKGAEKGFINTKILVTQPFKDDPTRKAFKKDLNEVRGAENSSEVIFMEASQMMDDLKNQIKLEDLSGEYNDKLFEYSDKQAEKNICKAFSVPLMLVSQTDNSLFGQSGEMLQEAKLQLWESREEDRMQLEEAFSLVMSLFQESKRIEEGLIVSNPYIDSDEAEDAKNINKQAQATLRGSVGGVTAIVQLVQAVKEGTLDKENAVAVVKNIYGFSDKKAKEMVGGYEEE